jgi:hypothetical protein
MEKADNREMASNYGSHKSTGSRRSTARSGAAEAIIQEAAKRAELLVKIEALKKQKQLAWEEEELKWKRQTLEIETELAITEARIQVMEDASDLNTGSSSEDGPDGGGPNSRVRDWVQSGGNVSTSQQAKRQETNKNGHDEKDDEVEIETLDNVDDEVEEVKEERKEEEVDIAYSGSDRKVESTRDALGALTHIQGTSRTMEKSKYGESLHGESKMKQNEHLNVQLGTRQHLAQNRSDVQRQVLPTQSNCQSEELNRINTHSRKGHNVMEPGSTRIYYRPTIGQDIQQPISSTEQITLQSASTSHQLQQPTMLHTMQQSSSQYGIHSGDRSTEQVTQQHGHMMYNQTLQQSSSQSGVYPGDKSTERLAPQSYYMMYESPSKQKSSSQAAVYPDKMSTEQFMQQPEGIEQHDVRSAPQNTQQYEKTMPQSDEIKFSVPHQHQYDRGVYQPGYINMCDVKYGTSSGPMSSHQPYNYGHSSQRPYLPNSRNHFSGGDTDIKKPAAGTSEMVHIMKQQGDLTKLLLEAQIRATLPQRNILTFNGDPLEYVSWMTAFEHGVELKTTSERERLYFLEQHTSGPAKALVKSCMHLPPGEAYTVAKALLKKKYGNKYRISQAIMKKVQDWPDIKSNNVKSLENFSLFLHECTNTMSVLQMPNELDHVSSIRVLVSKLPYRMKDKWRNIVDNIEEVKMRSVKFNDLVDFIDKQARVETNPAYGDIRDDNPTSAPNKGRNPRFKNLATTTTENVDKEKTAAKKKRWCHSCESDSHSTEVCRALLKKPYQERNAAIRKMGLCYACLKKGSHLAKDCKNKLTCNTCKRRHPTVLHWEREQPENKQAKDEKSADASMTCGLTGAGESSLLSIVPVTVFSSEANRHVRTYALLDNKSTAVFCSKSLQRKLCAQGKRTKIRVQTINGVNYAETYKLSGLSVSDNDGENVIELPETFVQETIPITEDDIIKSKDMLKPWPYLQEVNIPEMTPGYKVELLIGNNVPKALEPLKVIQAQGHGPFACKTQLGWEVHGLTANTSNRVSAHRIKLEEDIHQQLVNLYNQDFTERLVEDTPQRSRDDQRFINIVEKSIQLKDGHYEMSLPLRNRNETFPNNQVMAESRMAHLKRKFQRNPAFKTEYVKAMNETINKGYAEVVADEEDIPTEGKVWYIPHHGVQHPRKHKIRIVFDCAATFKGTSLNKQLLQGPDFTNSLVGVLTRFRQEPIAAMSDVEGMFNQVKVSTEDRDLLRFLWWQDGDTSKPLTDYRMTTHLFGAVSSPSCSNYALRQTAVDNKDGIVADTVNRNFYVDDCLKSVSSEEEAIALVEDLTTVLKKGGFKLTKWVSNSCQVMEVIPEEDRASGMKSLDLHVQGNLPPERALGVLWSPETDRFSFKIEVKDHNLTRRGILSTVSALYDPLGFAAPVILPAKQLLQDLCRLRLGWDDQIPQEHQRKWEVWIAELPKLENFYIDRCFKPSWFESCKTTQLHHFADASQTGYGTASYLRFENEDGKVYCTLVTSKSRVSPLKQITIPRLELTAAVVAVKVNHMIQKELDIPIHKTFFWTDSMTVLRYINNESARFHTFVANRIALIRDGSEPSQWRYVNTRSNPADDSSRGLSVRKFLISKRWVQGPDFMHLPEDQWPIPDVDDVCKMENDPEVKEQVISNAVLVKSSAIDRLFTYFSSWYCLRRAVAWILRIKQCLRDRVKQRKMMNDAGHDDGSVQLLQSEGRSNINVREARGKDMNRDIRPCTTADMQASEREVIKYVQSQAFQEEINTLKKQANQDNTVTKLNPQKYVHVKRASNISKLHPFLMNGVLRVGGRLSKAALPEDTRFPMILPKTSPVTELILREIHETTGHCGRNHMLHHVRQKYWIINANSCARKIVNRCVKCRKYGKRAEVQSMADLPEDRVTPDQPPFTDVGMDFFGPFYVKIGRSSVKRYGAIFTCLATRAVHVEKADSMDTSACINAIRRFIARRGQVKSIRSDNGSNLVGARNELSQEIQKLNQAQIHSTLLQKNIKWTFNPPAASHHGGVWERIIRSIRKVLNSVLRQQVLTDDYLHTLLCEVEGILNSRPITRSSDDVNDLEALTPNHLLLLKGQPILPPNLSEDTDQYLRRRWKQVQYLADIFWRRWIREYLPQLQERQKWIYPQRNVQVGDIILVVDDTLPRSTWRMGRVVETLPDKKGYVRQVKIKTQASTILRPISKVCLLLEADMPEQVSESVSTKIKKVSLPIVDNLQADVGNANDNLRNRGTRSRPCVKPKERLDL